MSAQDYYPFGLTFNENVRLAATENRFTFNNKELDTHTGWIDYGARMYQSDLGRWFSVDPKAEKFYSHTPYKYGMNNPVLFIDLDGQAEIQGGYGQALDGKNLGSVTHYDYGGGNSNVGFGRYDPSQSAASNVGNDVVSENHQSNEPAAVSNPARGRNDGSYNAFLNKAEEMQANGGSEASFAPPLALPPMSGPITIPSYLGPLTGLATGFYAGWRQGHG